MSIMERERMNRPENEDMLRGIKMNKDFISEE